MTLISDMDVEICVVQLVGPGVLYRKSKIPQLPPINDILVKPDRWSRPNINHGFRRKAPRTIIRSDFEQYRHARGEASSL